jgi:hypothetical protein
VTCPANKLCRLNCARVDSCKNVTLACSTTADSPCELNCANTPFTYGCSNLTITNDENGPFLCNQCGSSCQPIWRCPDLSCVSAADDCRMFILPLGCRWSHVGFLQHHLNPKNGAITLDLELYLCLHPAIVTSTLTHTRFSCHRYAPVYTLTYFHPHFSCYCHAATLHTLAYSPPPSFSFFLLSSRCQL